MELQDRILKADVRMTAKRGYMLDFFYKEKRYANAKEVKEYLKACYGLEVSNDFVYKNLQLFVEKGLLQEFIQQQERQFFYAEKRGHYAVCTTCHQVEPIHMTCPVDLVGERYGQVESHRFEMFVTCPTCMQTKLSRSFI